MITVRLLAFVLVSLAWSDQAVQKPPPSPPATGKDYGTADNTSEAHQFYGLSTNHTSADTWSLRLVRPSQGIMEDFTIHLQGVPPALPAQRVEDAWSIIISSPTNATIVIPPRS